MHRLRMVSDLDNLLEAKQLPQEGEVAVHGAKSIKDSAGGTGSHL